MRAVQTTKKLKLSIYVCVLALVFMVFSCDLFTYKRIFPDAYYDTNFIEHIDFDTFVKKSDEPNSDASDARTAPIGMWDFAYRYELGWDNSFEYMSLERAEKPVDSGSKAIASDFSGGASGLSPSAPVYRLEMKNLIKDGDFESTDMSAWGFQGTSSGQILENQINGKSASISLGSNSLTSYTITPLDGFNFKAGVNYELKIKYDSAPPPSHSIRVNENASPISFTLNPASTEFIGVEGGQENKINFQVTDPLTITIDDITIKKKGGQKLRLLLAPQSTEPELIDLLYIFSFWVHPDPSVKSHTSPYMLDFLEPQMLENVGVSSISTEVSSSFNPSIEGWQKISVQVKNGNLMFTAGTTVPVLELVIDLDKALPGRILLAQPELRAYPDGY